MADTLSITIAQTSLTVTPQVTDISFTPVDNQITFYGAGKYSETVPAKGTQGQLQYNNGGNLDATPLTYYDGGNLVLGPVANISIGGGSAGYVLSTDGNGELAWTHTISDSVTAQYATNANTANTAGNANIANTAAFANVAQLAHNATKALGVTATIANVSISGGSSGYYLTTDGNSSLSWAKPNVVTALANLTDVSIANAPSNGQILTFNTTANKWVAQNPNSVSGVTKILAGTGVTLSPTSGVGTVTISASGGGSGGNFPTGGNTDAIFWNNDTTITANYTIPAGKNSMSVGPITIGPSATVTISPGSVWAII